MPVELLGKLVCSCAKDAEIVRQHLPEHIRLSQQEVGCISFDVSSTDDPLVWQITEQFIDEDAFTFHQQRTRASVWWSVTAHIARDFHIINRA